MVQACSVLLLFIEMVLILTHPPSLLLTTAIALLLLTAAGFAPIPDWEPLLPVPPFSEYPSGHQCTAGAANSVLQKALGTDKVGLAVTACCHVLFCASATGDDRMTLQHDRSLATGLCSTALLS